MTLETKLKSGMAQVSGGKKIRSHTTGQAADASSTPTFPQARQWCRLLVNVNLASHCIQAVASQSGTHSGATLPS